MSSHDSAAVEPSMMSDQLTRSTSYLVRAIVPLVIRFRSPNLEYSINQQKTKNATCHESGAPVRPRPYSGATEPPALAIAARARSSNACTLLPEFRA